MATLQRTAPDPWTHPRKAPVDQARDELKAFLSAWLKRHGLTRNEEAMVLAEMSFSRAGDRVRVSREEGREV